jgi:hypothetical protein
MMNTIHMHRCMSCANTRQYVRHWRNFSMMRCFMFEREYSRKTRHETESSAIDKWNNNDSSKYDRLLLSKKCAIQFVHPFFPRIVYMENKMIEMRERERERLFKIDTYASWQNVSEVIRSFSLPDGVELYFVMPSASMARKRTRTRSIDWTRRSQRLLDAYCE